jgi:hypothetical protein
MPDHILWGFCAQLGSPVPIKLEGGSLRTCHAEQVYREAQGWTCAIYLEGTAPVGLRLQACPTS